MNSNVNFLLEKVLKESVYSIEDIQKAIETQTPITINKVVTNNNVTSSAQFNIVPISIDQDTITGESSEQGVLEFTLDDVEKINFLDEAGVKMNIDTLGKVDVSALDKVAQKTDVVITEDEEILTRVKSDLENSEEEEIEAGGNFQEIALSNVKTWATQLNLDLGSIENTGNNVKKIEFIEGERLYTVLIYPDGGIRLSNHTIRSFSDFKSIIEFLKSYNE